MGAGLCRWSILAAPCSLTLLPTALGARADALRLDGGVDTAAEPGDSISKGKAPMALVGDGGDELRRTQEGRSNLGLDYHRQAQSWVQQGKWERSWTPRENTTMRSRPSAYEPGRRNSEKKGTTSRHGSRSSSARPPVKADPPPKVGSRRVSKARIDVKSPLVRKQSVETRAKALGPRSPWQITRVAHVPPLKLLAKRPAEERSGMPSDQHEWGLEDFLPLDVTGAVAGVTGKIPLPLGATNTSVKTGITWTTVAGFFTKAEDQAIQASFALEWGSTAEYVDALREQSRKLTTLMLPRILCRYLVMSFALAEFLLDFDDKYCDTRNMQALTTNSCELLRGLFADSVTAASRRKLAATTVRMCDKRMMPVLGPSAAGKTVLTRRIMLRSAFANNGSPRLLSGFVQVDGGIYRQASETYQLCLEHGLKARVAFKDIAASRSYIKLGSEGIKDALLDALQKLGGNLVWADTAVITAPLGVNLQEAYAYTPTWARLRKFFEKDESWDVRMGAVLAGMATTECAGYRREVGESKRFDRASWAGSFNGVEMIFADEFFKGKLARRDRTGKAAKFVVTMNTLTNAPATLSRMEAEKTRRHCQDEAFVRSSKLR